MKFMPAFRRDDDLDLFDDVFSAPFFDKEGLMKTDITEKDGRYNLAMDLPGFRKEDVKVHPPGALQRILLQILLCRQECKRKRHSRFLP